MGERHSWGLPTPSTWRRWWVQSSLTMTRQCGVGRGWYIMTVQEVWKMISFTTSPSRKTATLEHVTIHLVNELRLSSLPPSSPLPPLPSSPLLIAPGISCHSFQLMLADLTVIESPWQDQSCQALPYHTLLDTFHRHKFTEASKSSSTLLQSAPLGGPVTTVQVSPPG